MFYDNTPELAVSRSADASRTTHATAAAVDACRYFGALIVMALHGFPKYRLLAPISAWQELGADSRIVPDGLAPEVMEIANGSYRDKMPPEIKGSGYVIEAMEAALWAFQGSETFEEGVLLAANLGDDADTTAAIYGQLAGAYYSVEWIHGKWIARLAKAQMIIEYADRLWVSATRG
jgi:ADP-ribosylglycohydrolase